MKRFVCVCLVLALLAPVSPRAASPFSFLAADYSIIPFTDATLPRYGNTNILLVSTAALSLAIPSLMVAWEADTRNYTLLHNSKMLTFEYGRGTAFSPKESYEAELLIEEIDGETVYFVPLDLVCTHFGWYCSIYVVDWGVMLRVAAKKPAGNDKAFYNINRDSLLADYEAYLKSKEPQPSPDPTPEPTRNPAQTPRPGEPTPTPEPTPSPSPTAPPLLLYLTFEGDCGEAADSIDTLLYDYDLPAVFFLTADSMRGHAALLRRLSARYSLGLLPASGDGSCQEALDAANEQLSALAFRSTLLYRLSGEEQEARAEEIAALEQKGYQLWGQNLRLDPAAQAADMLGQIDTLPTHSAQVISLPLSAEGLDVLRELAARRQRGEVEIYAFEPGARPF